MSRRRRSTADEVTFAVYTVHPPATAPFVALVANAGPGEPQTFGISLGDAYELGKTLVSEVDALLAGVSRPWDHAPGRTPFASRSFGRAGVRASAADAPAPPRAGSRPTRPLDSAA